MRNTTYTGNSLVGRAMQALTARLPNGWRLRVISGETADNTRRPDAILELRAPDGRKSIMAVEAKRRVPASDIARIAARLSGDVAASKANCGLLVASFLTPLARQRLTESGLSYLDLTGNVRISVADPGLFIESSGADKDPSPQQRDTRSLKGGSAARIVRALLDFRPPYGVRELASKAGTNPGYVSRVLALLESEDVIERDKQGRINDVKWNDLIRRWAQDYQVASTNAARAFLEPRGTDVFLKQLKSYPGRWAITGSRATPREASVAPARVISCYVDNADRLVDQLKLRSVDTGTNVVLLAPFDSVIWERTRRQENSTCVSVSQCAVDLLTGAGREPSEAEALFKWMESNQDAWRD